MTPLRSCWPLLLAVVACRPTTVAPAADPAHASDSQPEPPAAEPTPAPDPSHPLELVPSRARLMVMAKSPQRLAQMWEVDRLAAEFPEIYQQLVSDMKRALGKDLLDPAQLAQVGVDPSAPIGIAVVDFHDEVLMVFGASPDPAPMLAALEKVTGKPLPERTLGAARLVQLDRELTLVLRHGLFAFVLVDRQRDGQPDYPAEVARIDPARSLAHAASMDRGHAGLPAEADVQGLLDVAGLLNDEFERRRRRTQRSIAEANQRLVEARQRGADAQQIEQLQQMIQDEQIFANRRRRAQQLEQMILSRTLGSIEGIGLAVDAGARGLTGRIHLALSPDSVFRDLLRPSEASPALLAVNDSPLAIASGVVDIDTAIDLLAQVLLADGTSYAEINTEIREDLQIDFDRTLRPLLTGAATFVLTSTDPVDPTRDDALQQAIGGILSLGVSDEAAARALLGELPARLPMLRWAEAPQIGGWSVEDPREPRTLWVGVGAGQVAIGSDLATITRVQAGEAGTANTHLPSPEPWRRLTEGEAVARLALHHRLPVLLSTLLVSRFDSFDMPQDPDFILSGEFPDQEIGATPPSKAVRRLMKKRDAASEEVARLKRRRSDERVIDVWNKAGAIGITAGSIRQTSTGWVAEGGHYVDGGTGRYLRTIVRLGDADATTTTVDAKLDKAQQRRETLDQQLLEARRKQLRRAKGKNKRREPMPTIIVD